MSTVVAFDTTPTDGTIHLGIGQPSADLMPLDLLKQATDGFFEQAQPADMNYGELTGDYRFRQSLARPEIEGTHEIEDTQEFLTIQTVKFDGCLVYFRLITPSC